MSRKGNPYDNACSESFFATLKKEWIYHRVYKDLDQLDNSLFEYNGVGLLIISQRSALVSKTLLSQCNTNITFSLVDASNILQMYIGGRYVKK